MKKQGAGRKKDPAIVSTKDGITVSERATFAVPTLSANVELTKSGTKQTKMFMLLKKKKKQKPNFAKQINHSNKINKFQK